MEKNITSIKKFKGTRVFKGKKIPRNVGKIRDVVFYPNKKRVAGFLTKRRDFLLMFKRKGHFISINGYYLYEDLAFIRHQKACMDKAAYKSLGLEAGDCVRWIDLPVVTESGEDVGVITDVSFVHYSGEVLSIKVSLGTVDKIMQASRTIPASLIKGFDEDEGTELALVKHKAEGASEQASWALLVADEALDIEVENLAAAKAGKSVKKIAKDVGVDTAAVSEKAKSVADSAGSLATKGALATRNQFRKTKGMFSSFKEEYDKARKE